MQKQTETCENCGRLIGKLETPWLHGEHVVCTECWQRLKTETGVEPRPQPPPPQYAPVQLASTQYVAPIPVRPPAVQTVEQTGKKWKLQILLASALSMLGALVLFTSFGSENPGAGAGLGCLALTIGLFWFVIVRIMAWWHHG
jgi:hypothetical protein